MPVDIASVSNPRIKRLIGLRDRRARDRESVFVVEGATNLDRAVASNFRPREMYYDPTVFDGPPYQADVVLTVDSAALDRASYRGRSQGVIAVFDQFDLALSVLKVAPDPLIVVVEAIEKPGNLGAVLRTADAVGADAVIAADPTTDPFNPNVIRASTGALFSVPLAIADLGSVQQRLKDRAIRIVAADPDAPTDLWEADFTGPCALLVGSEHSGLSNEARSIADLLVSIPMRGTADSLNASVATAVLAYEALRQRRHP
jgi:TrmH family RNA methyltransferase